MAVFGMKNTETESYGNTAYCDADYKEDSEKFASP
jgi:hypothetical protein